MFSPTAVRTRAAALASRRSATTPGGQGRKAVVKVSTALPCFRMMRRGKGMAAGMQCAMNE
jgi:hypothetical protein